MTDQERLADSAENHRQLQAALDRMLATLDRIEARVVLVAEIIERANELQNIRAFGARAKEEE
jgi:hypothetical protein